MGTKEDRSPFKWVQSEVEYSLLQTQGRVGKAAVETQAREATGRRVHTAQLPQRSFLCAKKKLLGSNYF